MLCMPCEHILRTFPPHVMWCSSVFWTIHVLHTPLSKHILLHSLMSRTTSAFLQFQFLIHFQVELSTRNMILCITFTILMSGVINHCCVYLGGTIFTCSWYLWKRIHFESLICDLFTSSHDWHYYKHQKLPVRASFPCIILSTLAIIPYSGSSEFRLWEFAWKLYQHIFYV